MKRSLAFGAFFSFLAKASGAAFSFIVVVMISRLYGADGAGLYFIVFTLISIGSVLARAGIDGAALKLASIAFANENREEISSIYASSLVMVFVVGVVVSFFMYFFSFYFLSSWGDIKYIGLLISFSIIPYALLFVCAEIVRSSGKGPVAMFFQNSLVFFLFLAIFPLSVFLFDWGYGAIPYSYFVSVLFSFFIALFYGNVVVGSGFLRGGWKYHSGLVKLGPSFLLVSSMHMVMSWADILMINVLAGSDSVGIYGICVRVATATAFVLMAVNSVVVPRYAALYERGDMVSLSSLCQRSTRWALLLSSPLFIICMFMPDEILSIFGGEITEGEFSLIVLSLGQVVNVLFGAVGYLLMMSGNNAVFSKIIVFSTLINISLNLLLIPVWGYDGAAFATAVSLVIMNLVAYYFVRKRIGINPIGIIKQ